MSKKNPTVKQTENEAIKANILEVMGVDTMTNKKMTKATAWNIVLSIVEKSDHPQSEELIEKIKHELELLAKKNSGEKKPTAEQKKNEVLKTSIVDEMEENRLYSITEMIKELPSCEGLTNQKVSAMVRSLIPQYIERIEDKRKAYFRKVSQ
jgi:hypothetical protein